VQSKLEEQQVTNQETEAGAESRKHTGTSVFSRTKETLASSTSRESTIIGVLFLVAGIIALSVSILLNSQTMALVGLGITFWGALFILMAPLRYVEGRFLTSTAISIYLTTDRIIGGVINAEKAYYVPPYSREEQLPQHLQGLKEVVAFISTNKDITMPPIEDIAQRKFMSTDKTGILIAPPGLGLLYEIKRKMPKTGKTGISDLCLLVPRIISEKFAMTKEMTMNAEKDAVRMMIRDSLYINLYRPEINLKSVSLLGCPIASAIACAIAETTGKLVTIQNIKFSSEDRTTYVEYQLVPG
jgi:hypothetical protein